MKKEEMALENFNEMNCNQSVLAAFGADFGYTRAQCFAFGLSFGGGMAKQGKTCGAVTGAYTVIGLWSAEQSTEPEEQKEIATQKSLEFSQRFEKEYGSIECKQLLGKDISIPADLEVMKKKHMFETECPKFVAGAARLLDEML